MQDMTMRQGPMLSKLSYACYDEPAILHYMMHTILTIPYGQTLVKESKHNRTKGARRDTKVRMSVAPALLNISVQVL